MDAHHGPATDKTGLADPGDALAGAGHVPTDPVKALAGVDRGPARVGKVKAGLGKAIAEVVKPLAELGAGIAGVGILTTNNEARSLKKIYRRHFVIESNR